MTDKPTAGLNAGRLQERLAGNAYLPGNDGYDQARMPWNLSNASQRPALVIEAANVADVVAAINFAEEHDLGVALQATGHGIVKMPNGGLLINTTKMNKVTIDPTAKTAYVEAGAVWGDVLAPAQEAGLAPLLGSSPGVGAVGYTLGGGMGWLVRKYGLAADSVRYFDVVTADGQEQRVSATQNPELFWGLRGGRSTFAVVTGMAIDLFPVTMVYGGSLIYPADLARPVLERYRQWITGTPEELTTSVALMNIPEMPGIPEMLQGKSVIMVRGCYCGPLDEAQSHFRTWQEGPEPMANFLGPLPFSQVAMISQDPEHPIPGYNDGLWLDSLDDEVLDTLIEATYPVGGPPLLVLSEVRHVGGAKSRIDPGANAVGHRDESLILQLTAVTPTPEAYAGAVGYMAGVRQTLSRHNRGVYPNFIEGAEAQSVFAQAYSPQTYNRLKVLKAQVDPQNRFRYGFEF